MLPSPRGRRLLPGLAPLLLSACFVSEDALEDALDPDGDGVPWPEDCAPEDPRAWSRADEVDCDGVDNDCDGLIDEGLGQVWYADEDGDGYGASSPHDRLSCEAPEVEGWVLDDSDCDDGDPAVSPGAPEVCGDEVDDDCDGFRPLCRLSGEQPALTAPWSWRGAEGRVFGEGLGAADLDEDGVQEIIAGSIYWSLPQDDLHIEGGAFVLSPLHTEPGEHALDGLPYWMGQDGDLLGPSLVGAGPGGVWVAAGRVSSDGFTRNGAVYLLQGVPEPGDRADAAPRTTLRGQEDFANLGTALALGRLTQGEPYLVVGSGSGTTPTLSEALHVFIADSAGGLPAGELGVDAAELLLLPEAEGGRVAANGDRRVSARADFNGDGADELVWSDYTTRCETGVVAISDIEDARGAGTLRMDEVPWRAWGEGPDTRFGGGVLSGPDLGGEPVLLVGALDHGVEAADAPCDEDYPFTSDPGDGRVTAYRPDLSAPEAVEDQRLFTITGEAERLGYDFALLDHDGDGEVDLAVAGRSWGSQDAFDEAGRVLLFYGPLPRDGRDLSPSEADAVFLGSAPGGALGHGLIGAEIDGDGVEDLIIAAPNLPADEGGLPDGAVFVFTALPD
ncbi:MAG: putative metal-binding motif-containing protein [Alphaproteobacteria bacterium]|nr:putative metal-binding motif-containing protein [Alphaproteobacteria bacterium]